MAIFRVKVGKTSRKGTLLNPIDFVVEANTNEVSVVHKYYFEKYGGFDVLVIPVKSVEVCGLPQQDPLPNHKTVKYIKESIEVDIDENLCAEYLNKKQEFDAVKERISKECNKAVLERNTHLEYISKLHIEEVREKHVKVEINATLKGMFVVKDEICLVK